MSDTANTTADAGSIFSMPEAPPITPEVQDYLDVALAGLDEVEQEQVLEAIEERQADHEEITEDTVHELATDAQEASLRLETVQDLQQEQAEEADAGNYERAEQLSDQAGYELEMVDDLGREQDANIHEAWEEGQALEMGDWHQDIAVENADAAAAYAETGDLDTAAVYADTAADAAEVSADYGDAGDHGGTYGASATTAADTADDYDASTTTDV